MDIQASICLNSLKTFSANFSELLIAGRFFEISYDLISLSFGIAVVASLQSLIASVSVDNLLRESSDTNRELLAQGVGNIASSLFGGIVSAGSQSRAMANFSYSGRTANSRFISGILALAVLMFCALLRRSTISKNTAVRSMFLSLRAEAQLKNLVKTRPHSIILKQQEPEGKEQTMFRKSVYILISLAACLLLFKTSSVISAPESDPYAEARHNMVENDLKARDITDPLVLKVMGKVKRHLFVDKNRQESAYGDYPLAIGLGQTISQPYIVALMTQKLQLKKGEKVLEIGTGSGYQAAVLAEIAKEVYSIEINKKLANRASTLLKSQGYKNIKVKTGDGFLGWEEYAPFDAVIITCSVNRVPPALIKQLKPGGRIILPLGEKFQTQRLVLGTKKGDGLQIKDIIPVRFVPMTGQADK